MKREKNVLGLLHFSQMQGAKGLAFCYIVCVILMFGIKLCANLYLFVGFQTGKYTQRNLTLNDFEWYGVEQIDDMTMVNATDDTQLWITENICNLYIKCSFSYDPGEFIAFYSQKGNGAFSAQKCVRAKRMGEYYVFEFPMGTKQIRVDTGIFPSIKVSFQEILVNQYSFREVMQLSTEDLFYLLVVPGVAYAMLDLLRKLFQPRKRKEAVLV